MRCLASMADETNPKGHHAPVFGWLCQALGVEGATTDRMFLFLVLRDIMAAATRSVIQSAHVNVYTMNVCSQPPLLIMTIIIIRLGLVGPLSAVGLQMSLFAEAEKAAITATARSTTTASNGDKQQRGTNHDAMKEDQESTYQGPRQDNPLLDILQVGR